MLLDCNKLFYTVYFLLYAVNLGIEYANGLEIQIKVQAIIAIASVTYEGVSGTKKWERIESYGPKFVKNIVQAISRDILSFAMQTLSHCFICGHVHDELIIECSKDVSLDVICEQMGRTPSWAKGLVMRADGYEMEFYKKD